MNVNVSPTEKFPSHHISLSDGTTTIGLIAVNPSGQADITAIRREPFPRTTLRGQEGGGLLSESQPPYGEFTRDTFIGGDGQEMADADRTRYYDGQYLWTPVDQKLYPAPRINKAYIPGDIDFPTVSDDDHTLTFGGSVKYAATKIVIPASGPFKVIGVCVNTLCPIDPAGMVEFDVFIVYDNNGSPQMNNRVGNTVAIFTEYGFRHVALFEYPFILTLNANTTYWIVQELITTPTSGYEPVAYLRQSIPNGPAVSGKISSDGNTWTNIFGGMTPSIELIYFNNGNIYGPPVSKPIPFEYKHSLYVVEKINNVTKLFMNGDRGVTTANTDKSVIADSTKNWTDPFLWSGAIVKIIESPTAAGRVHVGKWRHIGSNTSNQLLLTTPFEEAIGAGYTYVIMYTPYWQEITGHGLTDVTSVAATNEDVLYFAQGAAYNIRRTRWRNNGTAWVNDGWVDETTKADILLFAWDQEKKSVLWRAVNGSKPYIARCTVPTWGTALSWETEIYVGGDDPIRAITEYEGKIAVRKSTEMWMVKSGVPDKLSLNMTTRYSDENGVNNMCVYTPYLVFPYSGKVQFLVNLIAENKGPWSPVTGEPIAMQPIVGGLLVAYSRKAYDVYVNGENSVVYLYRDDAWHPVVTMPKGLKILSIYYQHIDGGTDVLWIFTINGIYYIRFPREWDYSRDPEFNSIWSDMSIKTVNIEPYAMLDTGIYNLGNLRLDKWWERIYVSAMHTTGYKLGVSYCTNPYDTYQNWYSIGNMEANSFCNIRKLSKYIQFRLYIYGLENGNTTRPYINGYNVEYLARVDDADMWVIPLDISDYSRDLNGKPEEMTAAQKQQQLDAWARSVVPLTMRSIDPVDDNKRVIIERSPRQIRRYNQMVDEPDHRMGVYTSIVIKEVPD